MTKNTITSSSLQLCITFSLISMVVLHYAIKLSIPILLKCNRFGLDLNKRNKPKVPESLGLVVGVIYLIQLFLFLPLVFRTYYSSGLKQSFPFIEFNHFLSGLLAIQSMVLLGLSDDVFELPWRVKIWLPMIASIPLLIVYHIDSGATTVVVPYPLKHYLGSTTINLGIFYYVYMAMMSVFCTNSVNILAGINGIETSQCIIIALTMIINSTININSTTNSLTEVKELFSLYLTVPFLVLSLVLLKQNWYPAKVFVGDTYCYFSGMVFAVVAILGHCSKTVLLIFGIQLLNFAISLPQLFKIVPCPRHRMPRYNQETDCLEYSTFEIQKGATSKLQRIILKILKATRFVQLEEKEKILEISNFTFINALLVNFGPMKESSLVVLFVLVQCVWSVVALFIRKELAKYFYT